MVSKPYGRHKVIAIIPISSRTDREIVDVILGHWRKEGLLKPSVARVHRLTTMLQSDLIAELGSLQSDDASAIKNSIRGYLNL